MSDFTASALNSAAGVAAAPSERRSEREQDLLFVTRGLWLWGMDPHDCATARTLIVVRAQK